MAEWGIMPKELLPIVIATVVWGKRWEGRLVRARCDTMAVVVALGTGTCKEKTSMRLLQCLAMIEAMRPLSLRAEHIKGVDNMVADALSRNDSVRAHSLMQVSVEEPTAVPPELLELLCSDSQSWTGQEWRRLLDLLSTTQ